MQFFQPGLGLKIIKAKFFIWTVIPLLITGIVVLVYFLSIKDFQVYPNNRDFQYKFYTDSAAGGNSKLLHYVISDSIVKADFIIGNKISTPYLGLSMGSKATKSINLNHYNQLKIKAKGYKINGIGIALFTSNSFPKIATKSPDILFYHTFKISTGIETYGLSIDKFKVPDWWGETNRIEDAPALRPDLKNLQVINISNAFTPNTGEKLSLEIYSISFSRDNTSLIIFMIKLEIVMVLGIFIIMYILEILKKNKKVVTISYKPIEKEITDVSKTDFIDFINQNFHNNQLTIELVSKETGTSQRKITNYIQNQFTCNFKTYINRLRINESKRLLLDTELNIGEVAFKVGFNNQSHFNRVFKTEMQINPTEFRDKHKT